MCIQEGIHGLSLANELVECLDAGGVQEECTSWISLVDTWLDRLMKKKEKNNEQEIQQFL